EAHPARPVRPPPLAPQRPAGLETGTGTSRELALVFLPCLVLCLMRMMRKRLTAPVGPSPQKVHRFLSDFSKTAQTRTAAGQEMQIQQTVCLGPYTFEPHNAQLRRGTTEISLTRKACEVLQYLVAHPGQLVTKDALFQAVWLETVVSEGVLTNCIAE